MKVLFDGIPIEQDVRIHDHERCCTSIMAFYINAGLEQGAKLEEMARYYPERYFERIHGA